MPSNEPLSNLDAKLRAQIIYESLSSLFVAGFIGTPAMNLLSITVHKARGS